MGIRRFFKVIKVYSVYHMSVRLFLAIIFTFTLYIQLDIVSWLITLHQEELAGISYFNMLDIGQGDSFLIETSVKQGNRYSILIDTGSDGGKWIQEYRNIERSHSKSLQKLIFNQKMLDNTIDIVMLSHDDLDHVGALQKILHQIPVGSIVVSPYEYESVHKNMHQTDTSGIQVLKMQKGHRMSQMYENGEVWRIEALFPSSFTSSTSSQSQLRAGNEQSLILLYILNRSGSGIDRMRVGENGRASTEPTTILLTGDAGINEELLVIPEILRLIQPLTDSQTTIDILKVGHHGSKTSTGKGFLETILPNIGLISAGYKNSYGHPHKTVLKLLEKFVPTPIEHIYRTDVCQSVRITIYKNGALGRRSCKMNYK